MKTQITILMLVLVSLGALAQHDHSAHASHAKEKGHPAFKDKKIEASYQHYNHLKDALVASNSEKAKKAATELQKSLASLTDGKKAADEAGKVATSSNIEEQRKSFSTLSNEVATLIRASKLASGAVYVDYCPMANNNEGAFWLSSEKEIKNPYFGDRMLTCGSVKETLQ
jgi:hypothetical protein